MSRVELISSIRNVLINLDEAIGTLTDVFCNFHATGKGRSAVLIGEKLSGKTSIIYHVATRFNDDNNVSIINGLQWNDADGTQIAESVMQPGKVLVIDHFEQFAKKTRQQFLYTIMNIATTCGCLVLCCSEDMLCVERFEKRVRSRFSQTKILTSVPHRPVIDVLRDMLLPADFFANNAENTAGFYDHYKFLCSAICDDSFLARQVDRLVAAATDNGYYRLKQFALLAAMKLLGSPIVHKADVPNVVLQITNCLTAANSEKELLKQIDIFGLFLLEIHRRLSKRTGAVDISYITLYQSFLRIFRRTHRLPKSKMTVYGYLDALVDDRLIDLTTSAGAMQDYRKVSRAIDQELIKEVWNERSRRTFFVDVFRFDATLAE